MWEIRDLEQASFCTSQPFLGSRDPIGVETVIPDRSAERDGLIPARRGAVRFAVGPPDGLTSNSWRGWATKRGDVYIVCRDNFREVKVSLHVSGRWRMGFTSEAVAESSHLLPSDQNRAWEVWNRPPASLPKTVVAYRLVFPTSELAVRPEQRPQKEWKNVVYIEAAPPGRVTVVSLFVTDGEVALTHASEPSFCMASLDIGNGRRAQFVAHGDPEGELPQLIEENVAKARSAAESAGIEIPEEAFGLFHGLQDDGSRFLFGARFNRGHQ